MAARN